MAELRFVATHVGSFPHPQGGALVPWIFERFPEMPAWPQLPARHFRESMYAQCAEGLPGVVFDDERERLFFRRDEAFEAALEGFYGAVLEADLERFAIGPGHAAGLHLFLDELDRRAAAPPPWVKGQVVGPFSFAMTVTDEDKRSLAYTPVLLEVATQGMAMKAAWMARRLRRAAPAALVVLDEPYLCSFGSAFVNVSREDVTAALEAAIAAIHAEGALAGLHCCGNTDWSLVLSTAVDVVNFDAWEYFGGLPLYPEELRAFVERGGVLSFGLAPTTEAALSLDAGALAARLDGHLAELGRKGIDPALVRRQSLVTPACGLGSKAVPLAERVIALVTDLSARLREAAA